MVSSTAIGVYVPQWSPVNVTWNTLAMGGSLTQARYAAMEPGERHREHPPDSRLASLLMAGPQWSPVNVTGNTSSIEELPVSPEGAAMEPGERHREHTEGDSRTNPRFRGPQWSPVNVTGNTSARSAPLSTSH